MLDDVAGIEAAAKELRAAIPELQNVGSTWLTQLQILANTTLTNTGVMLDDRIENLFEKLKAIMPKITIQIQTKE